MGLDGYDSYDSYDFNNIYSQGTNVNLPISVNPNPNQNQIIRITPNMPVRGINNIGATCYMNSVLQCLYHVYDLSNEFLKSFYDTQTLRMENLKKMPMTYALFDTIYQLAYGKKESVNPKMFNDIISTNKSFKKYEANDSKNLVLYTLDKINIELNEYKLKNENNNLINAMRYYDQKNIEAKNIIQLFNNNYNSLIGDLFHGLKLLEYKCIKCNNCIKNYQIFNIITCSIQKTFETKFKQQNQIQQEKKLNIIDCFKFEQIPISFTGNNKLFCEKCNEQNDGECTTKICIAPKILILFLDRGINNRFMCDVDFSNELDINEFLEEKGNKYKLIGVIEHLGQSGPGGHFIATCKHFDGNWYMFSDSYKKLIGNEYQGTGIPYLIFYQREN